VVQPEGLKENENAPYMSFSEGWNPENQHRKNWIPASITMTIFVQKFLR
jgi:hypothetical protein